MASSDIKQRKHDKDDVVDRDPNKATKDNRKALARRGIRSLATAVALPISINLIAVYFSGKSGGYGIAKNPFWFPNPWILQLTCVASSFLMGLSAWLVWAEGGFHRNLNALYLYVAHLALGVAWDLAVFRFGASTVGLVICFGMIGSLIGCSWVFRQVNPIAGELVRFCLAWATFLGILNTMLLFI